MTAKKPNLLLFTRDLRLNDHPALVAATRDGAPVIPVFVLDDDTSGQWRMGAAQRWWLHHSLESLARELERRGSRLILRRGGLAAAIGELVRETGAGGVYASRRPEPWISAAMREARTALEAPLRLFAGATLFPLGSLQTASGAPYKVFSPFWRACLKAVPPPYPLPAPAGLEKPSKWPKSLTLDALALLPKIDWADGLRQSWQPGEKGAERQLSAFLDAPLGRYGKRRDFPAERASSRLSPHLAMGEISPRRVWHAALAASGEPDPASGAAAAFLRELGWREFAYHLLDAFPDLPDRPMRPHFARFPWREDAEALKAWHRGRTGYPLVDAGMRELWETGWMHNRVRMVAASFLVKHLRLDWRDGERWFWDTLVDADLANNALGWQWVAGCGPDAAPYFRIFNPVRQSECFDPDGAYLHRWLPELAGLSGRALHRPSGDYGADGYPAPIVDHRRAREAALAAFESIKVTA